MFSFKNGRSYPLNKEKTDAMGQLLDDVTPVLFAFRAQLAHTCSQVMFVVESN